MNARGKIWNGLQILPSAKHINFPQNEEPVATPAM